MSALNSTGKHPTGITACKLSFLAAVILGIGFSFTLNAGSALGEPSVNSRVKAIDDADQPQSAPHTLINQPSIISCGGCHFEAYTEWSKSLHGRAWKNANVQSATRHFAKKSCRKCHSPQSVLLSGLDRVPDYRPKNQQDGVHCLSCHGLENGVAATRTIPNAPCSPRFDARLNQANLCYPCHEPTHGAFSEYRRSDAFALGISCADCHMQRRENGKGHSHGDHGGMNAGFVKRAIDWSAVIADDEVTLKLRNRSGHRFPGEIPSRSFLIQAQHDQDKATISTLRRPRKGEQRVDNRLEPDEERKLTFSIPKTTERFSLKLYFRPLPLLPLERCFPIGEWEWNRSDNEQR